MRVVSLFSGAGGLDLGFVQLGIQSYGQMTFSKTQLIHIV
jgi:site-specific DNA-cytosine methylase